jgi:LacI family transcriptional regulator
LKDIARDLNVSVMTVSKVVRGCADVGAETRGRVLARIKELNYQPNWVARSLAARRTFMIGLIVPDLKSQRGCPPPSVRWATTW